MRNLFVLLLIPIIVFAVAGCSKSGTKAEPDTENVTAKVNMKYSDNRRIVSLSKPSGASFTLAGEDPLEPKESVGLCADDGSWDAEITAYKHCEEIAGNAPFADYYFAGRVNEKEYASYAQEIKDLRNTFEGKPVKVIRYTYKKIDSEEDCKECFIGFEYEGDDEHGLFGIRISGFDEELSDNYLEGLFAQMFYLER